MSYVRLLNCDSSESLCWDTAAQIRCIESFFLRKDTEIIGANLFPDGNLGCQRRSLVYRDPNCRGTKCIEMLQTTELHTRTASHRITDHPIWIMQGLKHRHQHPLLQISKIETDRCSHVFTFSQNLAVNNSPFQFTCHEEIVPCSLAACLEVKLNCLSLKGLWLWFSPFYHFILASEA